MLGGWCTQRMMTYSRAVVVDCWDNSVSVTLSCVSLKSIVPPLLEAIQSVHPFENAVGHVRLPHGKQEYLGVLKGHFQNVLWSKNWESTIGRTRVE